MMGPIPNWTTLGNLVQKLPCQLNHLVITTTSRWRSDFTDGLEAFDEIVDTCQSKLQGIDYVIYAYGTWKSLKLKDAHAQAEAQEELQVRSCLPRFCARDGTQIRVIFKVSCICAQNTSVSLTVIAITGLLTQDIGISSWKKIRSPDFPIVS